MRLYAAIDLHSNNSVLVVIDAEGRKSSLPAMRKMTVRIVRKRPYPRALRLAASKRVILDFMAPAICVHCGAA